MKFNYKIDDLELRSCSTGLINGEEHTTAEIVKWRENSCYTIGYWVEGLDFKFVGERPLDKNIDWSVLRDLIKVGYRLLGDMI